ncbi:putative GTP-binding protein EngB [Cohnella xylanilytica]|uniref:Probable GTP-binding protein EngB n=1 Tax=Cohnella xylanilytica TaxID=557555 RepID=A0A841TW25_9BACL|nr:ribosome biogenesis GTP-binding protein YihA/YsxC [Cohnella xylanilytica]MBB6692385.1 YihA family ribosome biogenesis GTP-binding protein [Cohnella xylanilytica]GIO12517.1 putative GTP-binding protein EngB [Cohnella xylanilytica]
MKIKSSEFVISAVGPKQYPDEGLPEVALAGRSNVGKSSLINRMLLRKNLARTSSQPGKTQQLNYYRINGELFFVDVPGYGYAKVSRTEREAWGRMIENYLMNREPLKLVILLVDLRHPPTALDRSMYDWLSHYGIPLCVVGTKADKLSRSQLPKHAKQVRETLGMPKGQPLVLFSSETGAGRDELWSIIEQAADLSPIPPSEPQNDPQESEDNG